MHFRHVTLIEVWRQALVENADVVELGTERYPVRTPKRGLRQVDFVFEGNEVRGLEQNPETCSCSGKTPTPTTPSLEKPKRRSTRSCSSSRGRKQSSHVAHGSPIIAQAGSSMSS